MAMSKTHLDSNTDISASEKSKDAVRYQALLDDPETGIHLLTLLANGKGDKNAFRAMQDRIAFSKTKSL